MRKTVIATLCIVLMASLAWAQAAKDQSKAGGAAKPAAKSAAPAPQAPKPAPEVKRLAYLVGNWTSEGTMQPGPFGPGGKWTGRERNEWMQGGFFVVSNGQMTAPAPMGTGKGMAIFGYNADKKMYTYNGFNSWGEAEYSTGTVNGADWTWTSDSSFMGQPYKARFSMHEDSPTAYTMKFEMSNDGGKTWKMMMDGKAKKAGAAAK